MNTLSVELELALVIVHFFVVLAWPASILTGLHALGYKTYFSRLNFVVSTGLQLLVDKRPQSAGC